MCTCVCVFLCLCVCLCVCMSLCIWFIYYCVIVGNEKSEGTGKDGDDWFQINVIIVLVDR
jgi:hypothetical protein